jgi:hypothetical protein
MKNQHKTKPICSDVGRASEQGTNLTKRELLLQPWFLPAHISRIVRWLVPADYRQRMQDCFDDYGCLRCGRLNVPYKSNGMCQTCMSLVFGRLQQSLNKRSNKRLSKRYGHELLAKAAQARKILKGVSRPGGRKSKARRLRSVQLGSPVIDTF